MRKLTCFLIIGLFLIGCEEKDDNVYDGTADEDVYTDNSSETEDEGGCGPEQDESEVSDDKDLVDDVDLVDDMDFADDEGSVDIDNEVIDDSDGPCPSDMVESGEICIDKYEASRSDATESDQGTATGKAFSKRGVLPWMVNPMNDTHFAEFKAACETVGKRLCKDDEWNFFQTNRDIKRQDN